MTAVAVAPSTLHRSSFPKLPRRLYSVPPTPRPATHVDPVRRVSAWPTNGDLVVDLVRLGYLQRHWRTLDTTYGLGVWWRKWWPEELWASDLKPEKSPTGTSVNFLATPYPDRFFRVVMFDPPYVSVGGRKTSGVKRMHDGFGLTDAPSSPKLLQDDLVNPGLTEMARVVEPGGFILVKVQNYISSGKFFAAVRQTADHADGLGLKQVDQLEHMSGTGAQPLTNKDGSPRRQVHARSNSSTMLVFRAPGRRRHPADALPGHVQLVGQGALAA